MPFEHVDKYAEFLVKTAVNIQPGQTLLLNLPTECDYFAPLCTAAAFDAGARDVVVHYNNELVSRLRMERAEPDVLTDIKPWLLERYMAYAESDGGACVLSIYAQDPDLYKGISPKKIGDVNTASDNAMKPWRELTMGSRLQWCVASLPTESWAVKVFPDDSPADAVQNLWNAISRICRVDGGNPTAAWEKHVEYGADVLRAVQQLNLASLHFESPNGTDLHVGLADDNLWVGFDNQTTDGVPFLANVPTEEVFTAPHRLQTNGTVYSSLPFVYAGNLIDGMRLEFEDGKVVKHSAEEGEEMLGMLLDSDDGARHIGEVALIPAAGPIYDSGLLFYNTLYDENASCHIALGAGYPSTIEGGGTLSRDALRDKGLNDSLIHEDIMIGTDATDITGTTRDGKKVPVMRGGQWALDALK